MNNYWPNPFALRSLKVIHLIPGEHEEIWGRQDVGWEKVAYWSTKATISLKRIKIEETVGLLWRAYTIKNFGEKGACGAWAYPETAQIFGVPPIIILFCTHIHSIRKKTH